MEHIGQAAVLLAHKVTDGTVFLTKIQGAGSLAAATHLVEQARQGHLVALTQAAIVIYQKLGHDKQRNALDAFGCPLDARQHQVHDVLVDLVITAGDKNLVAGNSVTAIFHGYRRSGEIREPRTRTGFGHRHGAGESAAAHGFDPCFLLLVGTVGVDQVGISVGQADIAHGGTARSAQVGAGHRRYQGGQLHPAQFIVRTGECQPGIHDRFQRHLDLRDHLYLFAVKSRLVGIDFLADGQEILLRHGPGGIDRGIEGLAVVIGVALAAGQGFGVEQFIQHELEITLVKQRSGHFCTSDWKVQRERLTAGGQPYLSPM